MSVLGNKGLGFVMGLSCSGWQLDLMVFRILSNLNGSMFTNLQLHWEAYPSEQKH